MCVASTSRRHICGQQEKHTQHTEALNPHGAWRMLLRIMVNVLIIFVAKAKCVLPLSLKRQRLLPSNTNFHVYVEKKKTSILSLSLSILTKRKCCLNKVEFSRGTHRNSYSVRQNQAESAVIIFLTCKP